jgi:phosphopantetheinyl transferase
MPHRHVTPHCYHRLAFRVGCPPQLKLKFKQIATSKGKGGKPDYKVKDYAAAPEDTAEDCR